MGRGFGSMVSGCFGFTIGFRVPVKGSTRATMRAIIYSMRGLNNYLYYFGGFLIIAIV